MPTREEIQRLMAQADKWMGDGRFRRALGPADEAVAGARSLGEDELVGLSLQLKASLHLALKESEAAITSLEESVGHLSQALGPAHLDVLMAQKALVDLHMAENQPELALIYLRQMRDVVQSGAPLGGWLDGTRVWTQLADLEVIAGRPEQAHRELENLLAWQDYRLGPDHPHIAVSLTHQARLHRRGGNLPAAISTQRQVVAHLGRCYGQISPDHGAAMGTLAAWLMEQGEEGEAEILFGRALEMATAAGREGDATAGLILRDWGKVHLQRGQTSSAGEKLDRAVELLTRSLPADHPEIESFFELWAQAADHLGLASEAQRRRSRSLAIAASRNRPRW